MNRKRQEQLSKMLEGFVANLFVTKIQDPRLSKLNVTRSKVSPDLKTVTIYYSVLNNFSDKAPPDTVKALSKATGFVRSKIASDLNLRTTPKLNFVYDKNPVHAQRVVEILDSLGVSESVEDSGHELQDDESGARDGFEGETLDPSKLKANKITGEQTNNSTNTPEINLNGELKDKKDRGADTLLFRDSRSKKLYRDEDEDEETR